MRSRYHTLPLAAVNTESRDKQYKRLFARLGIKKNVKAKDWVAVGVQCQQRENEDKQTEVTVGQRRLANVRVSRALARYRDRIERATTEDSMYSGYQWVDKTLKLFHSSKFEPNLPPAYTVTRT